MTLQEALEYLNLPANCSKQLIRKRYLELKKDYLKAITNAPSDHFSALYRENLDKIEEAYDRLVEELYAANAADSSIQQGLLEVEQLINSLLEANGQLTDEGREKIVQHIDQISELQNQLLTENSDKKSSNKRITYDNSSTASEEWDFESKSPLNTDPDSRQATRFLGFWNFANRKPNRKE